MNNTKVNYKIKEVARKLNIPESVVEDIYKSQFKFYREKASELPLKTITTEEEFNNLKTTFYFKYIGKFYTKWSKIKKIKECNEKSIKNKLNNNEE